MDPKVEDVQKVLEERSGPKPDSLQGNKDRFSARVTLLKHLGNRHGPGPTTTSSPAAMLPDQSSQTAAAEARISLPVLPLLPKNANGNDLWPQQVGEGWGVALSWHLINFC